VKSHFNLVELLVVVAIIAILAAMLFPALIPIAKAKSFREKYGAAIPTETVRGILTNKIPADADNDTKEKIRNQLNEVIDGKTTLDDASLLQKFRADKKTEQEATGDTFERWSAFTGNPSKWSKQEFDALVEKNQVPELQYRTYVSLTGNIKDFTEEQFNTLKAKGLVPFPVKESQ